MRRIDQARCKIYESAQEAPLGNASARHRDADPTIGAASAPWHAGRFGPEARERMGTDRRCFMMEMFAFDGMPVDEKHWL